MGLNQRTLVYFNHFPAQEYRFRIIRAINGLGVSVFSVFAGTQLVASIPTRDLGFGVGDAAIAGGETRRGVESMGNTASFALKYYSANGQGGYDWYGWPTHDIWVVNFPYINRTFQPNAFHSCGPVLNPCGY